MNILYPDFKIGRNDSLLPYCAGKVATHNGTCYVWQDTNQPLPPEILCEDSVYPCRIFEPIATVGSAVEVDTHGDMSLFYIIPNDTHLQYVLRSSIPENYLEGIKTRTEQWYDLPADKRPLDIDLLDFRSGDWASHIKAVLGLNDEVCTLYEGYTAIGYWGTAHAVHGLVFLNAQNEIAIKENSLFL